MATQYLLMASRLRRSYMYDGNTVVTTDPKAPVPDRPLMDATPEILTRHFEI